MPNTQAWNLGEWQQAYHSGLKPQELLTSLLASLDSNDPAWITLISTEALQVRLAELEKQLELAQGDLQALPLYGIPFAVKDNIDVAGLPTTCACPAFARMADSDATVIQKLLASGAVVIGKTNLDQFATGLVGTRSPYGAVPNTFNTRYISGGSSSGSASVVARGLVPFALGTDTAGSGRVPAGLNNIVGLKPTRGLLSTEGVVPACRTLDCVSLFTLTVDDADALMRITAGFDAADPYSRRLPVSSAPFPAKPIFGIPSAPQWFGDQQSRKSWEWALQHLDALNVTLIPVDFSALHEMAALLYDGPWLAERQAAIDELAATNPEALNPVVHGIIDRARNMSAVDVFKGEYRRAELARIAETLLEGLDGLLMPTTPGIYTLQEVTDEPVLLNSQLGTYTNFVNLLDLCALALPAGLRQDGLPFGITLAARAGRDSALTAFGLRWQQSNPWLRGASQQPLASTQAFLLPAEKPDMSNMITVAVVGAHLSGMPLNTQLIEREAILLESTQTAAAYRLFALPDTVPPKPGLLKVSSEKGAAIAVELWAMPLRHFGSFVGLIPSPLGIGTLTLADSRQVKGFICETWALEGAKDITTFGGWRAYIASLA